MMKLDLTLPNEDLRWLTFVQRYEKLLGQYPEFMPLRRYVYGSIYEEKKNRQSHALWRQYASQVKHMVISFVNLLALQRADVLLWQDIERGYMYETINIVRALASQAGLTTCLLLNPTLGKKGLEKQATHIFPMREWKLPNRAQRFAQSVIQQFQHESLIDLSPYLDNYLRDYYGYIRVFRRIIGKVKPKIILFTNDQYLPSATLASVARASEIPTYVLQHGAPNPFQSPLQADKLLAWGEQSKRYFMRLGMPESRIIVSGSVLHDGIRFHRNTRTQKNRILLISNGNNIDRNGELPKIAYKWLALLQREENNYELFVRYHPEEWPEFKKMGAIFNQSLNDLPLHEALEKADVVVGYVSTALLEGVLTGRPVLQLLDQSAPHLCNYWREGVAIGVKSYAEFETILKTICNSDEQYDTVVEKQRASVQQHFYNHSNVRHSLFSMLNVRGTS